MDPGKLDILDSKRLVTPALITILRTIKTVAILLRLSCDGCPMLYSDFIALLLSSMILVRGISAFLSSPDGSCA